MSNIGIKIRQLRDSRNLSQQGLSEQLGITQTMLHNIECGKSQKIDFLLMHKVCSIFEKDPEYFLENSVVHNINIKENSGKQVSYDNSTTNNYCPESLLEELKKMITSKDEQIELLRQLLSRK
jgi:transcriptional regulator with XRE-family HTH domain